MGVPLLNPWLGKRVELPLRKIGDMEQLLLHLWGDYILQSDWMASNKTKASWPCACHVAMYSIPFLILRPSWSAFAVIAVTHFLIDRFRLARFVVQVKNTIGRPLSLHMEQLEIYQTPTGYPDTFPPWMAVWLLIIADNILHLTINYLAIRYL